MSNEVRGLLHAAATKPTSDADVAGAWRRGRRMRAQRLVVSGLAVVAIVAIAALGAIAVMPDDRDAVPPAETVPTEPVVCNALSTQPDIPSWVDSANPPNGVPHLVSPDGNVVAVVFARPLQAGTRTDGTSNKILWIMRQPRNGQPLRLTATLPESV